MREQDEHERPDGKGEPAEPASGTQDDEENGRTAPFGWVSLVIIVTLVVGTWFLIQELSASSKMQDCIQSGRRNCAPIDDTRP